MESEYVGAERRLKKRLIVCCDGTWMNSDYGFAKAGLFSKKGTLQVPSNVTRISRCFKRRCRDGTLQIMTYESGVGSGSNTIDSVTGGAFGAGLAERVREAYAYLCANYTSGDEIVLVGFSRGAFTVRSVAGIISNLGLLTREGVEQFYPIFKDMQNWMNDDYVDPFPDQPFANKPKGSHAADEYRARLHKMGYTRVWQESGRLIKVKAVCVWDTVGSLGVPRIPWLEKLGVRPSNEEFKWHDTSLSDKIEHAFQALALDETRAPFSPAVWERPKRQKITTDLRQVWFPGNHGNIGGGWSDQGVANCSLAWMIDQMASIGVEFDTPSLRRVYENTVDFYLSGLDPDAKPDKRKLRQWAVDPIYDNNKPVRPWALGAIQKASGFLYSLSGETTRTPGMYKQVDPKTSQCRERYLRDTNEKVHSSVRVRLACEGLGLNDDSVWTCAALSDWRLKRAIFEYHDGDVNGNGYAEKPSREGWVWKYAGHEQNAPNQRVMAEDTLGPYERYFLDLAGGKPNVLEYADRRANRSKRGSRSGRTRRSRSSKGA